MKRDQFIIIILFGSCVLLRTWVIYLLVLYNVQQQKIKIMKIVGTFEQVFNLEIWRFINSS